MQHRSRGSLDKLITWNIKSYPDACVSDSLNRTIYVKFDDPISKTLHRNTGFAKELRQCAPIIATVKTFSYCLKCLLRFRGTNFCPSWLLQLLHTILRAPPWDI